VTNAIFGGSSLPRAGSVGGWTRLFIDAPSISSMAGTSLLALLDDIATLLDDVGALTKAATGKTAGVLGDDLALNAEQVSGVRAERELPVVFAVFKGSLLNKVIIVPIALALSYFLPVVITPLLMLGGAYLCFEGFEKIAHRFFHPDDAAEHQAKLRAVSDPKIDLVALEKEKIRGAIRTDFILSMEIIVIALGTVQTETFLMRSVVLSVVALGVTLGVYALVAAIVKMDDLGLALAKTPAAHSLAPAKQAFGSGILWFAPRLMRGLSILGTAAMFLVGGGIIVHGLPFLARLVHGAEHVAAGVPTLGTLLGALTPSLLGGVVGIVCGALLVFSRFETRVGVARESALIAFVIGSLPIIRRLWGAVGEGAGRPVAERWRLWIPLTAEAQCTRWFPRRRFSLAAIPNLSVISTGFVDESGRIR
jgi:predicted DNA repair protein MutK